MSDTPIYDSIVRDYNLRRLSYQNPIMEPERKKGRGISLRKKAAVKTLAEAKK